MRTTKRLMFAVPAVSRNQTLETRVKTTDTDGLRLCGLNTGPAADPRTWVIRG